MKLISITVIALAGLALGQAMAQSQAEMQAAVAAAIQQQQLLQSYGDAWAARRGYTYNPWTSYYQYRDERRYKHSLGYDMQLLQSIMDADR